MAWTTLNGRQGVIGPHDNSVSLFNQRDKEIFQRFDPPLPSVGHGKGLHVGVPVL